jgi:acyl-CoA synthetase (AMP-forming)/AMP-acid ligase II
MTDVAPPALGSGADRTEDPALPFQSPYPDVDIPDCTLTEAVLSRAEDLADKPALIDGPSGRSLTYGELRGSIAALASALAARGFKKGEVFAIFAPNAPEYAVAFHGVASAGGVSTTINPLYTADELCFQLKDSGARYLLTVPSFLDRALEGAERSGVEEVFVIGEGEGATPFASLLEAGSESPHVQIEPAEDLVVVPYSSGTTGLPKGVMLSHRNIVANLEQVSVVQRTSEQDVVIGVLPFFHIYGMTVVMNHSLHQGATVVIMPRFELHQFLELLQEHKVTRANLVPPVVLALSKDPAVDDYDVSSLGLIISGAAPLGVDLAEACAQRLGCLVLQGYGLTETSPVTHSSPEDPGGNRPGSVGPALPSTEVRVTDVESAEDRGTGESGEVWIRGPQVMSGYLNNDEATRDTLDEEGWLHTGDVGYVDEDGYLFLVDRMKELIKYKGYQVAPAELEAVLISHQAIADVAVIPCPDEDAGEVPKAFVVRTGELEADEVMAYAGERLSPQKKVRRVEFVEEIPKSPSGKILRRVLVEREREAQARRG